MRRPVCDRKADRSTAAAGCQPVQVCLASSRPSRFSTAFNRARNVPGMNHRRRRRIVLPWPHPVSSHRLAISGPYQHGNDHGPGEGPSAGDKRGAACVGVSDDVRSVAARAVASALRTVDGICVAARKVRRAMTQQSVTVRFTIPARKDSCRYCRALRRPRRQYRPARKSAST
jgi:hypothetical protein